jgi:hypothetical protein
MAYQAAQWEQVEALVRALAIGPSILPEAYTQSLAWADDLSRL